MLRAGSPDWSRSEDECLRGDEYKDCLPGDVQVQSYLGHLDGMHFSIQQLRDTMVGKAVRKISKWALEPTSREAALHAKYGLDSSRLFPILSLNLGLTPPSYLGLP